MIKDLIISDLIDRNNRLNNLIIHNVHDISTQELEEIFNNVIQIQEKLSAIIGFQYMLKPVKTLKDENINFNLSIMTFIVFEYITELINKILYSLVYCVLAKYQLILRDFCDCEFYNVTPHLKFINDYKNTLQFVDIYIDTDYKKYVLYEVKHKDNIKEYFQELISHDTYTIIRSRIETLAEYKIIADHNFSQVVSNYKNIGYRQAGIGYVFFWLDTCLNKQYYYHKEEKFILYKYCSIDTLNDIFKDITYCGIDLQWLITATNIVKDIKTISDKLNKKTYVPNFQRNTLFDLSIGNIGLKSYTNQSHKDLINGFNKIQASIELNDYSLQQIIIHSHAYVIQVNTFYYDDNEYKAFICRYFNKIRIKIIDSNNKQVSVRLKRKILVNTHLKESLIYIHKKYFTPDITLMKNINKFLKNQELIWGE